MHYFYDHIGKEDENLGSLKQSVTSIDVSSCSVSSKDDSSSRQNVWTRSITIRNADHIHCQEDPSGGVNSLTDGDTKTYWESDGLQGQHWIRLHMKRGTVVKSGATAANKASVAFFLLL